MHARKKARSTFTVKPGDYITGEESVTLFRSEGQGFNPGAGQKTQFLKKFHLPKPLRTKQQNWDH